MRHSEANETCEEFMRRTDPDFAERSRIFDAQERAQAALIKPTPNPLLGDVEEIINAKPRHRRLTGKEMRRMDKHREHIDEQAITNGKNIILFVIFVGWTVFLFGIGVLIGLAI